MKKIIALSMSVLMLLLSVGCSNKADDGIEKVDHSVNVTKLAREGRIPEVEFIVGDPVDGVKDSLFKLASGMSHDEFVSNMEKAGYTADGSEYTSYINMIESDGRTILSASYTDNDAVYCMYSTEKDQQKISAIAVVGKAYGFDGNTVIDYVKGAIDEKFTEDKANSNLAFLPKGDDGATCLSYDLGIYKLEFYFSNYNTLSATVLYNTELW